MKCWWYLFLKCWWNPLYRRAVWPFRMSNGAFWAKYGPRFTTAEKILIAVMLAIVLHVTSVLYIHSQTAQAQQIPGAATFGIMCVGNTQTCTNTLSHVSTATFVTPSATTAVTKTSNIINFPTPTSGSTFPQSGGYLAQCGPSGNSGVTATSAGLIAINCFVSGINQVTMEFVNMATPTVTPAAQIYRVDVWWNVP